MAEDNQVSKEALHRILTNSLLTIPEFKRNREKIPELAFNALAGMHEAVREISSDYDIRAGQLKSIYTNIGKHVEQQIPGGLSPPAIDKLHKVLALSLQQTQNVVSGKPIDINVPSHRVVDQLGVIVDIGGRINPERNIYQPNISAQIEDPFGIRGLTARGQATGNLEQPITGANVGASYRLGDQSDVSIGVDPIEESARIGFKAKFKKGGKLKKNKNNKKNYAKGSTVRTANY